MIDDLDEELLLAAFLPEIQARAEAALALWEEVPRKQDLADRLYLKTESPRPELEVTVVPGGFEVTIRGPQVEFFERGNAPGGGNEAGVPIRPTKGRVMFIAMDDGTFLAKEQVKSYAGTEPWWHSVEAAFADL